MSDKNNFLYNYFLKSKENKLDKWHHYFDIYEENFKKYKGKDVTLLEIGVFRGASLKMWKEYFGKNSKIYGIDINPECKKCETQGIKVFCGNQSDPKFLKEVISEIGKPDIIIDDGGHTSNQQIVSYETLYNLMKDEGIYVVEDTHTSSWAGWQDRADGLTFTDYASLLSDKLNSWFKVGGESHFRKHPDVRIKLPVAPIAKNTFCIIFYNSMIVFYRKPIKEPYSELR